MQVSSGALPSCTGPSVHSCSVVSSDVMLLNFDCCRHGLPCPLLGPILILYLLKVTGVKNVPNLRYLFLYLYEVCHVVRFS